MSCLDVMYQVYAPPQPYFTPTYSPYHHHHHHHHHPHPHHQKLAFYSKMQEESSSGGSSFPGASAATIKEEEQCASEKEQPPGAEYLSSRCVLLTYFQGDISAVVDEHFSRALSQPSGYAPGSTGSGKASRVSTSSWKDGSFPMSQRSFPPSFWNSAYQPPPGGDPSLPAEAYPGASLHGHLHQAAPEPWHHHHHHAYPQASPYPRASVHEVYGAHFDPRYGSLLVPSVRPHRLAPTTCDLGKGEAWAGTFGGAGPDAPPSVDAGLQNQDKSKDLYWF